jgi:mannose-6-phosphate isomerase-like protein (cupin superfamily)
MPVGVFPTSVSEFCQFSAAVSCSTIDDFHDEREIGLVVSGTGVTTLDAVDRPVVKGDTICFKPLARHKLRSTGEELMNIFGFSWLEPN